MVVPPLAKRKDPAIYARAGAGYAPAAIRRQSIHYSLDPSPGGYFPEYGREFRLVDWVKIADAGDPVRGGRGRTVQVTGCGSDLSQMPGAD